MKNYWRKLLPYERPQKICKSWRPLYLTVFSRLSTLLFHPNPNYKIHKSPVLRKAELDAKKALSKWKVAGKPKNEESILFKN